MRDTRTAQISIFESGIDHQIAYELKHMSQWLDQHPELLDLVAEDVLRDRGSLLGRRGLTVETILRCAILKQYRQVDYRTLAFYLQDSVSFIDFARLGCSKAPGKSTLQSLISVISDQTWLQLNRSLLASARELGIEDGTVIRVDSTVTDTAILKPMDSGLLSDSVRVMVRLLKPARQFGVAGYRVHLRKARRLASAIRNAASEAARYPLYEQMLQVTRITVGYLQKAYKQLRYKVFAASWVQQVEHFQALIDQVIDQTERRVINGEQVPAPQKIVSLFEPHTDIIVKSRREVQYGHKISISTGASALVLDVIVEHGNPPDSHCLAPILNRHIEQYGQAPVDLAADGGYASKDNLSQAKSLGVEHSAFHKRVGLTVEEMTGDQWLYNKLRRFRAGIEATISYLKRCFGLSRCNWKGLAHFKSYVHSAVFTHNLVQMAYQSPG
ncbi:MAG: ISNCY family transposase [Burkholderiaceae bacterium]